MQNSLEFSLGATNSTTSSAEKKDAVINIAQQANIKSRPILKFDVGNGLHNQLMSLVDGMVLGIFNQELYDVVLLTMWGGFAVSAENRSQPMQFGDLYDANHFIGCISSVYGGSSFRIFRTVPSEFATENIVFTPKHDGRKINDENNWNSTQNALLKFARLKTVVNIGRFYAKWDYKLSDSKSSESRCNVLQCIKPTPSIQNVVAKEFQAMRLNYLSSNITVIPLRLETD